ncbi:hypothetical protein GCM10009733_095340 [Nonomuraea maheshkhaliensis]|uniref:DUF4142 domain-containing protein n=1 Tax=Nonomuraea maheshkhaliensis TaxID=419590 RepID=A0ABN2H8R5_9ACTN
MRIRRSRRVTIVCGLGLLCSTSACATYTPTPVSDVAAISTATAGITAEPDDPASSPAENAEEEKQAATRQTEWGPLSEADQELVRKVRLASLWEMPIAQDAVQRASIAKVRDVSKTIASQHHTLDKQVREVASKLEIKLPVKPTTQQQSWMSDISSRSGAQYDATYVKWLRLAHGQIFGLIGAVRGSTQNTLIRRFAEQCNSAVLNHQRLLESTGLTTPASFPSPPAT